MTKVFVLFSLLSLAFLQGCSTTLRSSEGGWPSNIPERDYYVDAFRADAQNQQWQTQQDYLRWVVRFYQGWALYPRGWEWLSSEVGGTVEQERKMQMSQVMASLGERISAEWSKDGRARTVNTTHLMIWGDALKLAVKNGTQFELANQISTDVDDLLGRRIEPKDIDLNRYFGGDESDQSSVAQEDGFDAFEDPFDA